MLLSNELCMQFHQRHRQSVILTSIFKARKFVTEPMTELYSFHSPFTIFSAFPPLTRLSTQKTCCCFTASNNA